MKVSGFTRLKSVQLMIFSGVAIFLLVTMSWVGRNLTQSIQQHDILIETTLIRASHQVSQLQREILQLALLLEAQNQQSSSPSNLENVPNPSSDLSSLHPLVGGHLAQDKLSLQVQLTQSRFSVIQKHKSFLHLDPEMASLVNSLQILWQDIQLRLQQFQQYPQDSGLKAEIVEKLTELEIQANSLAQLNRTFLLQKSRSFVRFRSRTVGFLGLMALSFLIFLILGSYVLFKSFQSRQRLLEKLEQLATIDQLTQIPNRRQFESVLALEWDRMLQEHLPLSIIFCDIDHFKAYNDYYGHPAGDRCIYQVAQTLQHIMVKPHDFVARYGGEEFVILLPETSLSIAEERVGAIQKHLCKLNLEHGQSPIHHHVTVSAGIASGFPCPDLEPHDALLSADQALYQAKHKGRNCYCTAKF